MSDPRVAVELSRIAEALERIVYLLETEPLEVKIPNLHPSLTTPAPRDEEEVMF